MTAPQQTGEETAAVANRPARRWPGAGVVGDHALVSLVFIPADITVMMIQDQDRPVLRVAPQFAHNVLVPIHKISPGDAAPPHIDTRIDRISQHLLDGVVNRKFPDDLSTPRAMPDRRKIDPFLTQPQMHLAPAAELGEFPENQGNGVAHPLVGVHLDPVLSDLHIADRNGREQFATTRLLPLRLA